MFESERQKRIIDILSKREIVKVSDVATETYSSLSTIRRDMIKLETAGLIRREHGYVRLSNSVNNESSHLFRETENKTAKEYVAQLASNYIEDGQTIFLDSSSTVNHLCRHIRNFKHLVIVTNGLKTALEITSTNEDATVYITGGEVKKHSTSVVGEISREFSESISIDIAFFSCRSVDEKGIYEADINQGVIKKNFLKNAQKKILLCDSSKLFSKCFYKVSDFSNIDSIILEHEPPKILMKQIEEKRCEVVW